MTVEKLRCDWCKKETESFYDSPGWIRIESGMSNGSYAITISCGRKEGGMAQTKWRQQKELHFCCQTCFVTWLNSM